MASSDNVVRAGFTPKFKDVDTLTDMLTYSYAPISEQKMSPTDYPFVTLNTTAYSSSSSATLYDYTSSAPPRSACLKASEMSLWSLSRLSAS